MHAISISKDDFQSITLTAKVSEAQNCVAKLDIATSLLYQYYATVPVLLFYIFSLVKIVSTTHLPFFWVQTI